MNRFIILDGLPYLYSEGCVFAVKWDDNGFTVGKQINKKVSPSALYGEREIKAKCVILDSIGATVKKSKKAVNVNVNDH